MFDVPPAEKCERSWSGDVPLAERDWSVGLIVGPSGSGKSTIMRDLFGEPAELSWSAPSVVDDFAPSLDVETITKACSAVGFNTIPAWLRPFHVLSNGERFRVELARRLCESADPVVVDEFTSVVDRQVAKIGSHAVQKWARRNGRRFVAVTCHYDVVDWLRPDWVLEPETMSFSWRSVQPRPRFDVGIARVDRAEWARFAPFHYLTSTLPYGEYYGVFVDGVARPVGFTGIAIFPHWSAKDLIRMTRTVVLPDWQGLGLSFVLNDALGAAYKAFGWRFRDYPAHPGYVAACMRSPHWRLISSAESSLKNAPNKNAKARRYREGEGESGSSDFGGRPCAVFEYCGPTMSRGLAERFIVTPGGKQRPPRVNVTRKRNRVRRRKR